MNIQSTILIGSLIYTLINLAKYLRSKEWNGAITIVTGFVIGVVVVFLASSSGIANDLVINGITLGNLDNWSKVLVGLVATGLFSSFHDLKSAIDGSVSSSEPKLVGGKGRA